MKSTSDSMLELHSTYLHGLCSGCSAAQSVILCLVTVRQARNHSAFVYTSVGISISISGFPIFPQRPLTVSCRMPAPGMMSTLMFGICISLGQFTPKHELWKTVSIPYPTGTASNDCFGENKTCPDIYLALCCCCYCVMPWQVSKGSRLAA